MGQKIGLIKKLKLFNRYKNIIKKNRNELMNVYRFKIDRSYRLYTVVNIPQEVFGNIYNNDEQYINNVANVYLTKVLSKIDNYLLKIGLIELYSVYQISRVLKKEDANIANNNNMINNMIMAKDLQKNVSKNEYYSYLVIIGFNLPKMNIRSNEMYSRLILYSSLVAVIIIFVLLFILI